MMKRRIEPDQVKELTPGQQERLRELWKPEKGDVILKENSEWVIDNIGDGLFDDVIVSQDYTFGEVRHDKSDCLPLLDIGQMMELLESKDECLNITKLVLIDKWGYEIRLRQLHYYGFSTGELCDALWGAVKAVL
jgi:hypothetical protein